MVLLKKINYALTFLISTIIGLFFPSLMLLMLGYSDIEGALAICILLVSLMLGIYIGFRLAKFEKHKMQNVDAKYDAILFLVLLVFMGLFNPMIFTYVSK